MKNPKIGDERFILETILASDVEKLARKQGWTGGDEGIREFVEPEDAACHQVFATLDDATEVARLHLSTGGSFYGCAVIDRQVYDRPTDDSGRTVRVPPCWDRQESYEVDSNGERMKINN